MTIQPLSLAGSVRGAKPGTCQFRTQAGHKQSSMFWFKIQLEIKHLGDTSPCLGTDPTSYLL